MTKTVNARDGCGNFVLIVEESRQHIPFYERKSTRKFHIKVRVLEKRKHVLKRQHGKWNSSDMENRGTICKLISTWFLEPSPNFPSGYWKTKTKNMHTQGFMQARHVRFLDKLYSTLDMCNVSTSIYRDKHLSLSLTHTHSHARTHAHIEGIYRHMRIISSHGFGYTDEYHRWPYEEQVRMLGKEL